MPLSRPGPSLFRTLPLEMEDALTCVLNDVGAAAQKLWALAEANLHLVNKVSSSSTTVPASCLVATNAAKADRSGRSYFDLVDRVEQHARDTIYRDRPRSRLLKVLPQDELDEEERAVLCVVEPRRREGGEYMAKLGELFSAVISRHAQSLEWRDELAEQEVVSIEAIVARGRESFLVFDSAELPLREENVLGPADESFIPPRVSERKRNHLLLAKCASEHAGTVTWSARWGPGGAGATPEDDTVEMGLPSGASLVGIECPTCLNDFTETETCEPRSFPCGHSVCLTCVEQLISTTPNHQRHKTVKCPTCRVGASVPTRLSLPKNYSLLSFLQQNKFVRKRNTSKELEARRRTPLLRGAVNGPLFARLKLMSICLQAAERNLEGLAISAEYCVMSYRDILLDTLQRLRNEAKARCVPELGTSKKLRACLVAHVVHCLEAIEPTPTPPARSVFANYVADPAALLQKFSRLPPQWPVKDNFLAFVEAHNRNVQRMHVLCSDPQLASFSGYQPQKSYREMLEADKATLLVSSFEQRHPLSRSRRHCSCAELSKSIAAHDIGAADHEPELSVPGGRTTIAPSSCPQKLVRSNLSSSLSTNFGELSPALFAPAVMPAS